MPHKLLIQLKNYATTQPELNWVLFDEQGSHPIIRRTGGIENLLAAAAEATNIIVVVPAVNVLLTQVTLPKLSPTKLMKALPFALEDQLSEDTESMHFAIGEAMRNTPLPVAVISQEKMLAWKAELQTLLGDYYSRVNSILPDVLAIPYQRDGVEILLQGEFVLVRTGKQSGFVIETEALFPVLELFLKLNNVEAIHVHSPNAIAVITPEQQSKLNIPVYTEAMPANVLTMFIESIEIIPPINLLQGTYAPAQRKISFEQLITIGFAIIGIWLVLLTVFNLGSYLLLSREHHILNNEMSMMFTSVYPQQSLPSNPKIVMQKELSVLRASRSDSGFMRLLTMVGPSLAQFNNNGLSLKGLSYRNNELLLDVEASDLTLLEKLRAALEAQGLKVVLSNAQRDTGGLTETRFTIEEIS